MMETKELKKILQPYGLESEIPINSVYIKGMTHDNDILITADFAELGGGYDHSKIEMLHARTGPVIIPVKHKNLKPLFKKVANFSKETYGVGDDMENYVDLIPELGFGVSIGSKTSKPENVPKMLYSVETYRYLLEHFAEKIGTKSEEFIDKIIERHEQTPIGDFGGE